MQKNGYYTAIIGKYHLNSLPYDNETTGEKGGFDYWNILDGQGEYYNPTTTENGVHKSYDDQHVINVTTNLTKQ